ncbi:uncharacterized protein NEMAJ01_1704 [Nematocida major]|uniref:uncharacterized protein n=1 Tax=Nematocida major TaxID=1912982 RepID=UPI0020085BC4|nr:uncharacterized protein NEMAJ01_1704 [Nematocida major]KAH9386808.1 hypothetical protein NEMAJ01_1704 [Nematocida major]
MKKFAKKTKTQEEYLQEVESINYKTSLEAQKTLNSIFRTTDKTMQMICQQRERLEAIREESNLVHSNLEKGNTLAVKMKRAGKLIVIGDKIGDEIKGIFKTKSKPSNTYTPSTPPDMAPLEPYEPTTLEEHPTEQSTNSVLVNIRNGLRSLKSKLAVQQKEIDNQMPLIKDITDTNTKSTESASKVMNKLRKI